MTEYLFYISLVFIPIACWIAYLLNKDGFDIKTIILVLVLSYLMITAFPFSVQHLGTGITILVYGAIFAVLILVMCKPELFNLNGQSDELGSELAGKSSLTVPGGETTVFAVNSAADTTQQTEVAFVAGDHALSEPPEQSTIPEEVLANETVSSPAADTPVDFVPAQYLPEDQRRAQTRGKDLTDQKPDSVSEQIIPEAEQLAAVFAGDLSSLPTLDMEPPDLHYSEELESQSETEKEYHDITQDVKLLSADQYSPSMSESAVIDSAPDQQAADSEVGPDQQAIATADYSDAPATVDDIRETKDNLNQDIKVFSDAASPTDDSRQSDDQAELADWIERGFEAKAQGDLDGAAESFTRALQVSTDDELKYLLGMELVSILQNIGNYEQAEIILDDLIQTISAQPAMTMELRQQKQYINLLADELNRLGLAGTPIFEVPRLVRMKVNEKMLA
ncbi:MAG TPA: hypothetical protein PLM20_01090 [Syntrophomonadaceae bacterium]|nr:hypothetical protein [Syntrophomonadaceae bacterium]HQA06544.1 hypothetical protein [Syntrophomonadaceae bacterium]HQE22475.1 hypothetical protein [Syntrophomonadaceae bacterium]